MAYTSGDLIRDDEYNLFATGSISGTATAGANVNHVWGVGNGDSGYGQSTTLSAVTAGNQVAATQWSTLLSRITTIGAHQGTSLASMTSPVAGNLISIIGNLATNITSIHTNRLNAAATGSGTATNIDSTGNWSTATTQVITVTFSSGDAARYFFNAGGSILIDPSYFGYTSDAKARSWDALTQMFGQLRISANSSTMVNQTTSATVTESHTSNNATAASIGYYNLTTSNQLLVTKTLTTGGSPYLSPSANNITVNIRSNGTQGSNADRGSVITITVAYNDAAADTSIPSDLDINDGTVRTITTVTPPSTAQLTNTWGTPSVARDGSSTQS